MSHSIQSKQPWAPRFQQPMETDDQLRYEIGWQDVASGLGRVLYGYFLLFVCVMMIVGVVMYLIGNAVSGRRPTATDGIIEIWVVGLGVAIAILCGIYTYIQIFAGKVRCAIHAPERCGARWFIFACLLCISIGPVLGSVNSVAVNMSVDTNEKKQKLRQELMQQMRGRDAEGAILGEIRRSITITQIAGLLVSLGTTIFFVLFLRSIGNCFEEKRLIVMCDLYLMFSALLMGFSIFLVFSPQLNQTVMLVFAAAGLGGLISGVWYVALVIYTRILILTRMARLRSPLEG